MNTTTIGSPKPTMALVLLRIGTILAIWICMSKVAFAGNLGDFTYEDYGPNIAITSYLTSATGAVVIPDTINGKPVTRISNSAFSNCFGITSISIPSSVTWISDSAFAGCEGLTSVTIPSSVTSIGNYAFAGCEGLTSVTIPSSVTSIGSGAFSRCEGLTSVTIPPSITTISGQLFEGCTGLTTVTIPSSVSSIENLAFGGCTGLTAVTIPSSVTSIGSRAFFRCIGLASVSIPSSVTSIQFGAFSECNGLTSFVVNEDNINYRSVGGVIFNKDATSLNMYPPGKGGAYTLPVGVISIGDYAFSGCVLTSITIPSSVTSIGSGAFQACAGLTSITIPSSVTSIGSWAFEACGGLTSITIPSSVTSIERAVFRDCGGLTSVTIPKSITTVGSSAFSGCSRLTSIVIPASLKSIDTYAFEDCSLLTSVYFRGNAPTAGYNVFYGVINVTVYYLAGATGWGASYAGRPTALYQIQSAISVWDGEIPLIDGSITPITLESGGVGMSVSRIITIMNNGMANLTLGSIIKDGSDAADFSVSAPGISTLTPGSSTTFTVTFTPSALGPRAAAIHIMSNVAGVANPFDINLAGTSRRYTLRVSSSGGTVVVSPQKTDYAPGEEVTLTAIPNMGNTFIGWSGDLSGNTNPQTLTIRTWKEVTANFGMNLSNALGSSGLVVTGGGDSNWFGQSQTSHDGTGAAQSGLIGHGQNTSMEITLNGAGTLSFWWKVSSESGYDFLEFYIDGLLQPGRISGEVGWIKQTFSLGAGSHTLRWRYVKDTSETGGSDAAWVDQVAFGSADPYSDWFAVYFSAEQLANPAISGDTADPDRDGISNVMEFLFGGNPIAVGTTIIPCIEIVPAAGGPNMVFIYKRKIVAAALTQIVEYTSDPTSTWIQALHGVNGVTIATSPVDLTTEQVTVTIPAVSAKGFARLAVSR